LFYKKDLIENTVYTVFRRVLPPLAGDGRSVLSKRDATLYGRDSRPNSIDGLSHGPSLSPLPSPICKVPRVCILLETIGTQKLRFEFVGFFRLAFFDFG